MTSETKSPFSSVAKVFVISDEKVHAKFNQAWVLISSRIYWKEKRNKSESEPQSLTDFCKVDSLELNRLNDGATWHEVEETAKADKHLGKPCIIVSGSLHGPTRRRRFPVKNTVRIKLVPEKEQLHKVWLRQIRARVTPWELLMQLMKTRPLDCGMHVGPDNVKAAKSKDDPLGLTKHLCKLDGVIRMNSLGTEAVETTATLVKVVESVESVVEVAQAVADISKCVGGVSTVLNVVVLCARGVARCAEVKHGRQVLPSTLARAVMVLSCVLKSTREVFLPSSNVEPMQEEFAFGVLKQTVNTMDEIEMYILSGWGSQFLNAKLVREMDARMENLESNAVEVINTGKIARLERKSAHVPSKLVHHQRPRLSPFFVGRTKELDQLKGIVKKRGSAFITQYGGAGKTELMVAFAERAEREKQVPGGVFWVNVDGEVTNVLNSLARLVTKLSGEQIAEEKRKNTKIVVTALSQELAQRKGRWLLCLDNADNENVGGILNAICSIADSSRKDGWVLVTSRQGKPWNRMKPDQNLRLKTLDTKDSMVVLWRQSQVIENVDADDEEVIKKIRKLKKQDPVEYQALKNLCGDRDRHVLGGLPLALVQAGAYIGQCNCTFREYRNMLKKANKKEDLESLMKNSEQLTYIREDQRSIWTTWRISVEGLTVEARSVLRAMSMLGNAPISLPIVNGILKAAMLKSDTFEAMHRNVFLKELVHGSSLVYREEGRFEPAYGMHGLVRSFILYDMETGSDVWNKVFDFALLSVHEQVLVTPKYGPRSRHLNNLVTHPFGLIDNFKLPGPGGKICHASKLQDILQHVGPWLHILGNFEGEVRVWRTMLAILQHQYQDLDVIEELAKVHNSLSIALLSWGKLAEVNRVSRPRVPPKVKHPAQMLLRDERPVTTPQKF